MFKVSAANQIKRIIKLLFTVQVFCNKYKHSVYDTILLRFFFVFDALKFKSFSVLVYEARTSFYYIQLNTFYFSRFAFCSFLSFI